MGHINFSRGRLVGTVDEIVGYKAGLALDLTQLRLHASGYENWFEGELDDPIRIHSIEFEELIATVLHAVGYLDSPELTPAFIRCFRRYRDSTEELAVFQSVVRLFTEVVEAQVGIEGASNRPIDLGPVMAAALTKHGSRGLQIAGDFIDEVVKDQNASPYGPTRRIDWTDSLQLDELFASESLKTSHGTYFDQRFIDYLSQNFDSIDTVNWRKFEALTCEFFTREGFCVEAGSGRNDDGVDVRVWTEGSAGEVAPTMLVQCKRTKRQVEKVVVKALWADVTDAGASSGLVVTTSSLSPGARKTCQARSYAIGEANRESLRSWLAQMRSPYSGAYMAE